jgi:hypothetical protein
MNNETDEEADAPEEVLEREPVLAAPARRLGVQPNQVESYS